MTTSWRDIRWTYDMCSRGLSIIEQRVCRQVEFLVFQTHIIIEHCLFGVGMVFSPVRGQHRLTIHQFTTFEEVSEVIHAVVVQRVSIKCRLPMTKNYIIASLSQLVITIIIGIVTCQAKGVTLLHLHMAKSFEGVRLFIEVSTITEQVSSLMAKMHVTMQHLCITITILVIVKIVGMYQIYTLILHFLSWRTFALWLCCKSNSKHQYTKYEC